MKTSSTKSVHLGLLVCAAALAAGCDDAPTTPAASIQLAAQTADTDAADTDPTAADAAALDCEALFDDVFGVVEWTPTPEELAEWQTEADEVRALLDAAGASYETVTEFGLTFPEPTDDAGWAIVDQYFVDKYGDDVVNIDLDEMDLSELDLDGEFGIDGGVVVAGEALELTDEELAQLEDCEKEFFGDLEGCEVIDLDELPADETEAVPAA